MTLHRSTNLMGTASFHEAGERPANPIAAGTRPLTAEERAARRKWREDEKKVADTLVAVNNLLFKHQQRLAERGCALLQRVSNDEGYRAIKERLEHVHVGIDMAKPDSEATVIVETREPKRYFWVNAPTGADLVRKIEEKGNWRY